MELKNILFKKLRFPGIILLLLIPGTIFLGVFATGIAAEAGIVVATCFIAVAVILCWSGIRRIMNPADQFLPILTQISIVMGILGSIHLLQWTLDLW